MNMPSGVAKEMIKVTYGANRSTELTKKQASNFIQDLLLLKEAY